MYVPPERLIFLTFVLVFLVVYSYITLLCLLFIIPFLIFSSILPVYPLFDSICIATPLGFIPLLFPLVGVLSSPVPRIVPLFILKFPDLIFNI